MPKADHTGASESKSRFDPRQGDQDDVEDLDVAWRVESKECEDEEKKQEKEEEEEEEEEYNGGGHRDAAADPARYLVSLACGGHGLSSVNAIRSASLAAARVLLASPPAGLEQTAKAEVAVESDSEADLSLHLPWETKTTVEARRVPGTILVARLLSAGGLSMIESARAADASGRRNGKLALPASFC